jgi:hypothetical protein
MYDVRSSEVYVHEDEAKRRSSALLASISLTSLRGYDNLSIIQQRYVLTWFRLHVCLPKKSLLSGFPRLPIFFEPWLPKYHTGRIYIVF